MLDFRSLITMYISKTAVLFLYKVFKKFKPFKVQLYNIFIFKLYHTFVKQILFEIFFFSYIEIKILLYINFYIHIKNFCKISKFLMQILKLVIGNTKNNKK